MANNEIESGYFWDIPSENPLVKLGIIKESTPELDWIETMFARQRKERDTPSALEKVWGFLTWVKDTVEEPLEEVKEGVFNIWRDVVSLAKWDIKSAPWLIWDFARSTRKWADKIIELNKSIDETGWTTADKAIWFGLNIFGEVVDFWWEVIMSGIKTIAPESLEQATEEGIKTFAQSEFWQDVIWFAKEGGAKWQQFKESSPEANRFWLSVESVLPVAEVLTWGLWGKLIKKIGWEAIETWVKWAWELVEAGKDIAWKGIESLKEWVTSLKESIPDIKIPDLPKLWENPSKIAENIAWIDTQTKNTLKEVSIDDFDRYVQVGKDAADNIKNPTPMEVAGQEASDVLKTITDNKKATGREMWKIVDNNESIKVDTTELTTKYQDFLRDRFNVEVDPKTLKVSTIAGKEAKTSDLKLLETLNDDILSIITVDDIGIKNLEAIGARIKSNFSKILNDRGVGSTLSPDEKSLKWFIGWEITWMIKKNLPEVYSEASNKFAKLLDIETRLGKLLWDKWDKWASFIKSAYSPQTWARMRRLAAEVKEETGIDLMTKAWIAKFAMQLAWDPRQASLLEALNLGTGFTGKLTSKLKNIPFVWDIAELAEIGAKKVFPTEKVGRWLTK